MDNSNESTARQGLSRRAFLGLGATAAVAAGAAGLAGCAPASKEDAPKGDAAGAQGQAQYARCV